MSDVERPPGRGMHSTITQISSTIMIVLGIAMVAVTLSHGGGALSLGIILGVLFVAGGAGRLWIARKGPV